MLQHYIHKYKGDRDINSKNNLFQCNNDQVKVHNKRVIILNFENKVEKDVSVHLVEIMEIDKFSHNSHNGST